MKGPFEVNWARVFGLFIALVIVLAITALFVALVIWAIMQIVGAF